MTEGGPSSATGVDGCSRTKEVSVCTRTLILGAALVVAGLLAVIGVAVRLLIALPLQLQSTA